MSWNGPIGTTPAAPTASSIALIDRPCSSWARQISLVPLLRMRLTDEARHLGAGDRVLLDRLGEVHGGLDRLGRGVVALDDLDQRHDRGGVEVVEADDLLGRSVASPISVIDSDEVFEAEHGVTRGHGVELGEDRLLDLHALGTASITRSTSPKPS
jgi:hypothetical protein